MLIVQIFPIVLFLTVTDAGKVQNLGLLSDSEANACTKLQKEVQKALVTHKWNLDNVKFQQRLKKLPKYIVTIQNVQAVHEPLVELRCPLDSPAEEGISKGVLPNLEFYFHETRFQAGSVRLFDIQSIFPIHSGLMSVKIKVDPLVVTLNTVGSTGGQGPVAARINEVYYEPSLASSDYAKEHRESDDGSDLDDGGLFEVEREIETIFTNRIKPDVEKQLKILVKEAVRKVFAENLFAF